MFRDLNVFTTIFDNISLMFCREQMFLHIGSFNNSTTFANVVCGFVIVIDSVHYYYQ
jgi:hypothetical protein